MYELFFLEKDRSFGISFDQIFKRDLLKSYNIFDLSSKRNFKNISEKIVETYNDIFLDEGGRIKQNLLIILQNILLVKSEIMTSDTKIKFNDFVNYMKLIVSDVLLDEIQSFISDTYDLDLDKDTASSKKIVEDLIFTDSHAKIILECSCLYKLMIPIISEYFSYNKSIYKRDVVELSSDELESVEEEDESWLNISEYFSFDDANSNLFFILFDMVAKEKSELIKNKIYKLVESRIAKTLFSDKSYWTIMNIRGVTVSGETNEIYKKIMTNNIAKLDNNSNVVIYFQSVINNSIEYLFQVKFKYKIQTLKTEQSTNDDNVTETEKIEIQMLRKDEGLYCLRTKNIDENISRIEKQLNIDSDVFTERIKLETFNITKNQMQERLLSIFVSSKFKDKISIQYFNRLQYTRVLLILEEYLKQLNFRLLSQVLMSKCDNMRERAGISGQKIRPQVFFSKKYKSLVKNKYSHFADVVENPISALIGTIYNNDFYDDDGNAIINDDVKVDMVANEILEYITIT